MPYGPQSSEADHQFSSYVLSQLVLGRPTGLLQSVGGLRAAAMKRWWSSSGAERAKDPQTERLYPIGNWQVPGDTPDCLVGTVSFLAWCTLRG